jgi:hypothetical protein
MRKIDCFCHVTGDNFSPSAAEKVTGLVFANKVEPGEIGTFAPYRGKSVPYGHGRLDFCMIRSCSAPDFLKWLDDIRRSIPLFRKEGAEDIDLDFIVAYKGQCNLEAEPRFFLALAQLGIPVSLSCWEDEDLPEEEVIVVE